jgi:predicted esterase
MKAFCSNYALTVVLIVFLLPGCQKTTKGVQPVHYTEPVQDSCREEQDHHYIISEPENIAAQQKLPLILVIDSHGDGKLAAEKFSEALVDIPAIIAGSEKIRNNYQDFESSLSHLEEDLLAKYPADPEKVIIAGFSGGARMAYYYGISHKVLGIIMFGAGPGRSIRESGWKRMYMVSGTRDFNFMEQYSQSFAGFSNEHDYMADFFRGSHEWPPAENIYESVAYVLEDDPDFPESTRVRIAEKMLTEYDGLLESNDLFLAGKALEKAWMFSPDKKRKSRISQMMEAFKNRPEWFDYNRNFEGYLQKEMRLKQAYMDKLADPDTSWWKKEIQSLNQNILSCSDPAREDFLYRLKGFIGILLYSQISTQLKQNLDTDKLDRLLVIYELAEPGSPDLIKFKQQVQHFRADKMQGP